MVFQRVSEGLLGAVKTWPGYAARILFINGLSLRAPVRIQPNLPYVGKRAHQRAGEAREVTDRLQGDGHGDRCSHNHVAIAFSAKIQHGSLAGKHSTFRRRNYGGESSGAPGSHAFVAQAGFIRRAAPWRRPWP